MHDPEVTRVKPAAGKSLFGSIWVLQVALHDDVAAHKDLAHRRPVSWHRREGCWVGDHQIVEHWISNPLACLEPCPLGRRQLVPFAVPGAYDSWAIDLGQPVNMGDVEAEAFHALDYRGGWCGGGGHHLDAATERLPLRGCGIEQ